MSVVEKKKLNGDLNERLTTGGFRFTPQRQQVYDVLLQKRDHPTAEEVFIRAKKTMPDISMATVYNCLDALVKCGLARQVHAGPRRDALLPEHARALPFLLRLLRHGFRRGFAGETGLPASPCREASRPSITKSPFTASARIARRKNNFYER